MNHIFPMKNSRVAIQLKSRLLEQGVCARVLVDPLCSLAPALADGGEIYLEVADSEMEKLNLSIETIMAKVS